MPLAGVAADDAGGAPAEAQRLQQGLGEPARLVGDHAPVEAERLDPGQHLRHAREQARFTGDIGLVDVQQAQPQGLFLGMILAKAAADQSDAAMRCRGANDLQRQGRAALFGEHAVEGIGQIRGGVGQGAVEVEQHRLDGKGGHDFKC